MDYIGLRCPSCGETIKSTDEVVVCPICGTPEHRHCYEELGECCNEFRHKEGYDFNTDPCINAEMDPDEIRNVCRHCGTANDEGAFFCKSCNYPLEQDEMNNNENNQNGMPNGAPFNNGPMPNFQGIPFDLDDPCGGVDKNQDMGEGVKAEEIAKYTKVNCQYFVRVFNNILKFDKSKFNFAAALFTGGYLLYRKMYKLGTLITVIEAAILAFSQYLSLCVLNSQTYQTIVSKLSSISYGNISNVKEVQKYILTLTPLQIFTIFLPTILSVLSIILMVVIGLTANRIYFNHCKKQIIKIKTNNPDNYNEVIEKKGGINTPLAISIFVCYIAIMYLPSIIMGLF